VIQILEIWVKEKVRQHLLSKGSAFADRGVIDGVVIAHLGIAIWYQLHIQAESKQCESGV
jgi:hypothetical protein